MTDFGDSPAARKLLILASVFLFVLGAWTRVWSVLTEPPLAVPPNVADYVTYDQVAKNLNEGHGFSSSFAPPYEPYGFRPPASAWTYLRWRMDLGRKRNSTIYSNGPVSRVKRATTGRPPQSCPTRMGLSTTWAAVRAWGFGVEGQEAVVDFEA